MFGLLSAYDGTERTHEADLLYVWDEDERARPRINLGMVDLEDMVDPEDVAELKALVEEHARVTGSERAQRILATWEVQLRKFVKVMPRDYKRALAELAAETAAVA